MLVASGSRPPALTRARRRSRRELAEHSRGSRAGQTSSDASCARIRDPPRARTRVRWPDAARPARRRRHPVRRPARARPAPRRRHRRRTGATASSTGARGSPPGGCGRSDLEPGDRILTWSPSTPGAAGRLLRGDARPARPRPARPAHVGRRGRGHRPGVRRPPPHPRHGPRRARPARGRPRPTSRRRRVEALSPSPTPDDPLFPPDWEARQAAWERPAADETSSSSSSRRGTTGTPKGVMLTHDNVVASIESFHRIVPPMEHRLVSLLPLSHLLEQAVGLYYALDRRGRHPVRPEPQPAGHLRCAARPPGDLDGRRPAGPRPVLERHRARGREARPDARPSIACAAIARHLPIARPAPAVPAASTRSSAATSGCSCRPGRSCRRRSSRRWEDLGVTVLQGYGATETGTGHVHDARRPRARAPSGGRPRASRCASRADGEIQFRGRTVFRGYWNAPEATAAAFTDDGWYRTGDIGHFDDAGRLILSGRTRTSSCCPTGSTSIPRTSRTPCAIAGHPRLGRGRDAPGPDRGGRPGAAAPPERERPDPADAARAGSMRGQGRQRDASVRTSGSPAGGCGPRRTSRGPTRSRSSARRSGLGRRGRRRCRSRSDREPTRLSSGPGSPTPSVSSAAWIAGRRSGPSRARAASRRRRPSVPTWRRTWTRPERRLDPARAGREVALLLRGRLGGPARVAELVDDDEALVGSSGRITW